MWKTCGYTIHKGIYPITAEYLVYNGKTKEILWTDEANNATIFESMEDAKYIFPEYNSKDYRFRICIMSDEPVNC